MYGSGGQFAYASEFLYEGESVLFGRKGTVDKPLYVNERFWTVDTMYYTRMSTQTCAKFLHYVALGFPFDLYSTNTALPSMTQEVLGNHSVLCPSLSEQTQIARFLDYETSRIDALIDKQQQLIALLKEKRQAVISHAVTKGLNPDAPMRDSGIEWLGEIPAHWTVQRAKHVFREQNRAVRPGEGVVTAFRDGQVCLRSRRRSTGYTFAILEHGYQSIRRGDLVIHSMDAFAGAIGVSEDDGRATPEYVVVTPYVNDSVCEYYARVLRVMARRNYIFVICPSVRERAPRFRYSKFAEVTIPVPPPAEQGQVAEYLARFSEQYMNLALTAERQVELLKERRTTLISAAVTGKIDVRDWTPPNESETP